MPRFGKKDRARAEEEKRETLARLARTDVVTMASLDADQTAQPDKQAAVARIKQVFLGSFAPDSVAEDLFDRMLEVLANAEANINFNAAKFFYSSKVALEYTQQFEKASWGDASYLQNRDEAEEKMFHYASGSGGKAATADATTRAVGSRIESYGQVDADFFVPSIRPRYITLNFAGLVDGMGAKWGRSHMVLQEFMKLNMTFVHSDSFDFSLSSHATPTNVRSKVAYWGNMARLIVNMSPGLLQALHDCAVGNLAPGMDRAAFEKKYMLGSTGYIEGHLHAELRLDRDISLFRIDNAEVAGCQTIQQKAKFDDPIAPDRLKKNIARFQSKSNVPIVYFD